MAKVEVITTGALHGSMTRIIAAHDAIREGIATHAQKHEHKLDERRNERERRLKIEEGIKRQGAKLRSDHQ